MSTPDVPTWRVRATYYTTRRALGGHLGLGADRLEFVPHLLDRLLGGRPVSIALSDVNGVEARRSGLVPRARLVVVTRDGVESQFLVSRLDERVGELKVATGL